MKTLLLGIVTCGLYWVYAVFKWILTNKKMGLKKIRLDSAYEVTISAADDSGMVDKRRFKKDMILLKKFMKKFNKKPDFFRFDILNDAAANTIGMSFLEDKEFFIMFKTRFPRWRFGTVMYNVPKKDIDFIARSLKEIKLVYKDRTDRVNLYVLDRLVHTNPEAVKYAFDKHKIDLEPIECDRCGGSIYLSDNEGRCPSCGTGALLLNNKRVKAVHTFAEKVAA